MVCENWEASILIMAKLKKIGKLEFQVKTDRVKKFVYPDVKFYWKSQTISYQRRRGLGFVLIRLICVLSFLNQSETSSMKYFQTVIVTSNPVYLGVSLPYVQSSRLSQLGFVRATPALMKTKFPSLPYGVQGLVGFELLNKSPGLLELELSQVWSDKRHGFSIFNLQRSRQRLFNMQF